MSTKVFVKKRCVACRGDFRTSNDSDKCYGCVLKEIAPDRTPTKAEIKRAEKLSGCMSPAELIKFYDKKNKSK